MELQRLQTKFRIENKKKIVNIIYLGSLFSLTLLFLTSTLFFIFIIIAALNAVPNQLWVEIPTAIDIYFKLFIKLSFSLLGTIVTFIVFIRKFLSFIK